MAAISSRLGEEFALACDAVCRDLKIPVKWTNYFHIMEYHTVQIGRRDTVDATTPHNRFSPITQQKNISLISIIHHYTLK